MREVRHGGGACLPTS